MSKHVYEKTKLYYQRMALKINSASFSQKNAEEKEKRN
jgi:hypothetical protein